MVGRPCDCYYPARPLRPVQCTPQQCNPFTIFAPNNNAFAALPPYFLSWLAAHPDQLAELLRYHVLDHRLYSPEIRNNLQARAESADLRLYPFASHPFPAPPPGQHAGRLLARLRRGVRHVRNHLRERRVDYCLARQPGLGGRPWLALLRDPSSPTARTQAENGAIHVVDTVLIPNNIQAAFSAWLVERDAASASNVTASSTPTPTVTATPTPSMQTLASWVQATPQLSELWNAVYTSGLVKLILEGPGPQTLLAPTNEVRGEAARCPLASRRPLLLPSPPQAFGLLPQTYLAYLLAHPTTALTEVLAYNILPYTLLAANVTNGTTYVTVEGQEVEGFVNANGTFFNNALVVSADHFLENGVAHATAAVLLPIATNTPSATPTQTVTPTQAPSGPARRRG